MSFTNLSGFLKENEQFEFKTSFQKETIETLVAFANAKGGKVLVGINDQGQTLWQLNSRKATFWRLQLPSPKSCNCQYV